MRDGCYGFGLPLIVVSRLFCEGLRGIARGLAGANTRSQPGTDARCYVQVMFPDEPAAAGSAWRFSLGLHAKRTADCREDPPYAVEEHVADVQNRP